MLWDIYFFLGLYLRTINMGHDIVIGGGEKGISEVILLFGCVWLVVLGKEVLESNFDFSNGGSDESWTLSSWAEVEEGNGGNGTADGEGRKDLWSSHYKIL